MFPIDVLVNAARAHGGAVALETAEAEVTFAALIDQTFAIATAYQDITGKVRPTVAVLSPNTPELFLAIMGVHGCGGILVPLNPRNARLELDQQLATADPDVVVVDPACLSACDLSGRRLVLTRGGDGTLPTIGGLAASGSGRRPHWPAVSTGDINAIKFTGGSSGRPKAVLQTFRNFNTVVASVLLAFDFRSDERYLVAAPMTHGAGMFMMPALARGGRCIVLESLKAETMVEAFAARRVTSTWVPPTLLYMLLDVPGVAGRSYALRHLVWGGAPANPEKLRAARDIFGDVVEAVFGQTEASTIATALRAGEIRTDADWQSVGRATPLTHVAIMDREGRELPAGEAGEIVIRGDLVMAGYLNMPETTAETIVDGWLHTGDVGYLDARGHLFIKDRIRDVVISGGFNIYPSDVEAALGRHPAVLDAVAFGVPDAKWGERLEAAVQLKAGAVADEDAILSFARETLGGMKMPKRVHVMAELPKSPVGKVLRRDVKALFSGAAG